MVRRFFSFSLFAILSIQMVFAASGSPLGYWQLRDSNQKPKMIIQIQQDKNNTLTGKLIEYYPNKNARCVKCTGKNKDKPIRGMKIIDGLAFKKGDLWANGKMLDPETGKTVNVKLTVLKNGSGLKIKTFGWFSLFGKNTYWTRRG